jgi:TDG/mug DNA glycosylase family protein
MKMDRRSYHWNGRTSASRATPLRRRGLAKTERPLPDYVTPRLKLLFIGINPGLISAAAGHYYANPRNPFWRLLYEARLTPLQLQPAEDFRMPEFGYGLTDIVKRPSRGAGDLAASEFAYNQKRLLNLVRQFRPRAVCFNSKIAFEGFFGKASCHRLGPQALKLDTVPVFVLPSTSPRNAATPVAMKLRYFKALRRWLDNLDRR